MKLTLSFLYLIANIFLSAAQNENSNTTPHCNCIGPVCECCGAFRFKRENHEVCLRTNYDRTAFTMTAEVLMNGNVLASRNIGPGSIPFCVPTPPLNVCLNARSIQLNPNDTKVCGAMNIRIGPRSIYKGTLPCLVMNADGQFQITRD